MEVEDLARIGMPDGPDFETVTAGSPVKRAGAEGLARNACLHLGVQRGSDALPVLRDVAEHHPSSVVRDAAQWAIDRLASNE